ncbi:IS5/IS1182 family transposase, partial [Nocardiopsis alba]
MSDVLPDGLWEIVQPLLPSPPKTGRPRADQRAVLTTV